MVELTEEQVLMRFNSVVVTNMNDYNSKHNKNFDTEGLASFKTFDHAEKSCEISYNFTCKQRKIYFQIAIKVEHNKAVLTLTDENENEDNSNYEFYKYFQFMRDKTLFADFMKYVKK